MMNEQSTCGDVNLAFFCYMCFCRPIPFIKYISSIVCCCCICRPMQLSFASSLFLALFVVIASCFMMLMIDIGDLYLFRRFFFKTQITSYSIPVKFLIVIVVVCNYHYD